MGIRFSCPNGHKLNVKEFLAGKRGVCPQCGAKFTIPTPSEVPVAESPVPVGVGQSQSVEIAVTPMPPLSNSQTASSAASPSVIIPVTEIELAPPAELPPVSRGTETLSADGLPASIVAGLPIVPETVGVTPDAVHASPRGRSRRNQILISLLLLALVVLLAGVLVWVLTRDKGQVPTGKKAAMIRGGFQEPMATSGGSFHLRTDNLDRAVRL